MDKKPQFPARDPLPLAAESDKHRQGRVRTTRDHAVIRDWASKHQAVPATGEATASGPATVNVTDGGAGVRFNFPGVSRFRPIGWEEWFENFEGHGLAFVYEEEVAEVAYEAFQARGGEHGRDQEDWFGAERQVDASPVVSARYRLIKATDQKT